MTAISSCSRTIAAAAISRTCGPVSGQNPNEIIFDFDGGTNLNPNKGFHMHDAILRFTDDNHMHAEWQAYLDGKPAQKHSFDLVRKQ